ncbi:MAG: hypothetical protein EOO02_10715 [Chitinophagaceae bacterium]|nr:MAG: hypothetical protein EOO02_10715 [Chitinophagaceae bacterium]
MADFFKTIKLSLMIKTTILLAHLLTSLSSYSQFVARVDIKEKIEGICDANNVIVVIPMYKGQTKAVCAVADSTIVRRLNTEVEYLKDKKDDNDQGIVRILINCKGQVVKCDTDKKTKDPILDEQILAVFKTVTFTKPAKLKKANIDSLVFWSFEIANGVIRMK